MALIAVVCLPLMMAADTLGWVKPVVPTPTPTATPPPGLHLVKVVTDATFFPSLSGLQGEGSMLSLRRGESIWVDLESVGRRRAWRDSGKTQFLGWVPQALLEPPKGGWPTPTKTSAPTPAATPAPAPTPAAPTPPTSPLTGEQVAIEIIALLLLTPAIVGGGLIILRELRYPEEEKKARRQRRAEQAAAEEARLKGIDEEARARLVEEARAEAREQAAAEHAARPD